MSKIFLAGDPYFNSSLEAKRLGLTVQEYNNKVVKGINEVAGKEDTIIFIGEIGEGDFFLTEQLNRLNCSIMILDKHFYDDYTFGDYSNIYIFVSSVDGVQDIIVDGQSCHLIYCASSAAVEHFLKDKNVMRKSYIAAAASQGAKEIFKNRVLNVSLSEWDYKPLEISERIPQIIDDMKLFESMEKSEVIL